MFSCWLGEFNILYLWETMRRTWAEWNCVLLPWYNGDVGLHRSWNNALEDGYAASHSLLVCHSDGVGFPWNCSTTAKYHFSVIHRQVTSEKYSHSNEDLKGRILKWIIIIFIRFQSKNKSQKSTVALFLCEQPKRSLLKISTSNQIYDLCVSSSCLYISRPIGRFKAHASCLISCFFLIFLLQTCFTD